MTPTQVLAEAERLGIRFRVADGRLMFAPKSKVTDRWRMAVRNHRDSLIAIFAVQQSASPPASTAAKRVTPDAETRPRRTIRMGCPSWWPVWCPYPETHHRIWRSIYGSHLICAICHPPAFESVVAEFIDLNDPESADRIDRIRRQSVTEAESIH